MRRNSLLAALAVSALAEPWAVALLIGQAVHRRMERWRPSIERDLLAKANDAIVKAADTREIRVGFSGLLKAK